MLQISCKNLCIGYDNKPIINNLNFEIETGDYFVVVGKNGSGKSTLIKTLLGLLNPISGSIVFQEKIKKEGIGYLPQQSNTQKDFPVSIWEVVVSGFLLHSGSRPFYNKEEKEVALNNINIMGLKGMENYSYKNLSGGQKQCVLLARALCATKSILLLDEPIAGLDPIMTKKMYEIIEKLNKDGITIVMISHDIQSAIKYANKVLYFGDSTYYGSKEDYIKSDIGRRFLLKGGSNSD